MYHLNSQLPAPYELQNQMSGPSQMSGSPQMMAKGGRARHHKMILAHGNPHELEILDHLQGERVTCPKTGLRSYPHLEELLKNPHIVANVHHHTRQHHAGGGRTIPELAHLAAGGRHGDSEMFLMGPHTHHLFDQLAGHKTRNPHTGHPEYFSISGLLSGLWDGIKGIGGHIWNGIKGIGSAAAPAVIPMAQQYLGNKFGSLGNMAGQALPGIANSLFGGNQGQQNPIHQAIGEGIGRGAQAYHGGASASQAFGQGMQHTGRQFGGGGLGSAMQGMGSALNQGQGFGSAMKQGLGQGFEGMGGKQGMMNMARNAMGSYPQMGMQGAVMNQMRQMGNRNLPSSESMGNLRNFEQMPFAEQY